MPLPLPFMVIIGFLINLIFAILMANIIGSSNEIVKVIIRICSLLVCTTAVSAFLTEKQFSVCLGMSIGVILMTFGPVLNYSTEIFKNTTAVVEAVFLMSASLLGWRLGKFTFFRCQMLKLKKAFVVS